MSDLFNLEAEATILGTILINNAYLRRVEDVIEAEHFYEEAHKEIYLKIISCHNEASVANNITLKQFFDSNFYIKRVGGISYLTTLLATASTIIDIRDYALVIVDLWRKRELKEQIEIALKSIDESNLDEILNEFEKTINKIDKSCSNIQVFDGEETSIDWAHSVEKKEQSIAIPTGLSKLDEMLNGGLHKEGLYVFGAASGCGKTFFSQNIILNALKLDLGALFVSMEMPKKKIFARFISILAKINSFRVLIGNIFNWEQEKFNFALKIWESYKNKFFIIEKISLSPAQIESAIKRVLRKNKLDLVVVDYAQIMKLRDAKNINEASLIKENVTALAKLAQKYKVSVLLLSQLTKGTIDGKVTLGSLKGSGGLYEDADCVIAMWNKGNEESNKKIKSLQIEIIKNRDGLSDGLSVSFDGDFGEFKENDF